MDEKPKPSLTPNIAKAGGIMAASLFLSRILGIVRDIIITAVFGQDIITDAYRISFQIPDLLFYLVAGGALSSAFIPVFTEYLTTDREDDAWHIFSAVASIMSVALIVFISGAWIFAPQLTELIAGNKDPSIYPTIIYLSRIVLPAQFAFFIGGLLFGTLYARQVFTVPGLGPNIYNIGIIIGALVISAFVTPSIAGLSWGALVGAFLGNIVVPLYAMKKLGARFKFTLDTKHEGVRKVFRLMAPVVLGLSLPGVFGMIMQYFATYYPDGVNSAYDLGNKLMQAPLGVFGQAMAIAAFPALSQFFAQGKMDMFQSQLSKTIRTVIFLALPISAIFFAIPNEIIAGLMQFGKFDAEDTLRTAPVLQAFAIGITGWCLQPVIMRAFFSVQKPVPPIVIGTIMTGVFGGTAWLTVIATKQSNYVWLPYMGSVAALVLAGALMIYVQKIVGKIDLAGIWQTLGKGVVAAAVSGGFIWFAYEAAHKFNLTGNKLGDVITLLIFGLMAAWVYFFAARAMKMPETAYLDRVFKRMSPAKESSDEPKS
ncbi:MAG: murein biosynthesis integral membrane protein MurJ [Armatimonadetes bacterium]|nr:murein biosynthesis integral membrane protein MurJ [Armatimonadota bacterium]